MRLPSCALAPRRAVFLAPGCDPTIYELLDDPPEALPPGPPCKPSPPSRFPPIHFEPIDLSVVSFLPHVPCKQWLHGHLTGAPPSDDRAPWLLPPSPLTGSLLDSPVYFTLRRSPAQALASRPLLRQVMRERAVRDAGMVEVNHSLCAVGDRNFSAASRHRQLHRYLTRRLTHRPIPFDNDRKWKDLKN